MSGVRIVAFQRWVALREVVLDTREGVFEGVCGVTPQSSET